MAKKKFEVADVKYAVVSPSVEQKRNADIHKSVTFGKLARAGVMFRESLFKVLREGGVWNDDKETLHESIREAIRDGLAKLEDGKLTEDEAKSVAEGIKSSRQALNVLLADYFKNDEYTVEGMSEQAKFQFLVSQCTIYDDSGKKVFASLEDFLDKQDSEVGECAALEFARLYHGYDEISNPEDGYLKTEAPQEKE